MFKFSSNYLDILKNGLEDWLYVFGLSNFYFYEMYLIYSNYLFWFFLVVVIIL